jgi:hypothetical protein
VPPTPPTAAELVTFEGLIDAASDELVWEADEPLGGHSSHKAQARAGWYTLSPTFGLSAGGEPFQGYYIGHSPSGGYSSDPDYRRLGIVRTLAKAKAAADWKAQCSNALTSEPESEVDGDDLPPTTPEGKLVWQDERALGFAGRGTANIYSFAQREDRHRQPVAGFNVYLGYRIIGKAETIELPKAFAQQHYEDKKTKPQYDAEPASDAQTADLNLSPASTEPAFEQVSEEKVEVLDKSPVNNKPPTDDELDIPEPFNRKRPVPAKD